MTARPGNPALGGNAAPYRRVFRGLRVCHLLARLSDLAANLLARIANTLALVRVWAPEAADAPDVVLERKERVARVRTALGVLNDREREALLLKAEGFSYDEIAATTGLARGGIGTTLSRARRKLVEAFHAEEARRATS